MRRTPRDEIFLEAFDCRREILEKITQLKEDEDAAQTLVQVVDLIEKIIDELGENQTAVFYKGLKSLAVSVKHLCDWKEALRNAGQDAGRFLVAYKLHVKEALSVAKNFPDGGQTATVINEISAIDTPESIDKAFECLAKISLPLPIHRIDLEQWPSSRREKTLEEKEEDVVAFLEYKIDNQPLKNPHPISPNTLHDLHVELRINSWPKDSTGIIIQPVSELYADSYQMPTFQFQSNDKKRILEDTKKLNLKVEQSFESEPIEFVYQAYLLPTMKNVSVVGNNRIIVRSDAERGLVISGFKEADAILLDVRSKLSSEIGITAAKRGDFLTLIKSLANIGGQALQSHEFPGVWSEKQFQGEIRKRLRQIPDIGSDLVDHPEFAGGISDLLFRKIHLELKVEDKALVTLETAHKYTQQAAQYAAGADIRLGVLCILDCSPKQVAPGSVANDIGLIKLP